MRPIAGFDGRLRHAGGVLVDSNVLLDVSTEDPVWGDWSTMALAEAVQQTTLVINPIIYAEISIRYSTIEMVESAFPAAIYHRQDLPWEAAFLAGKCFFEYRRRGGQRTAPLPDFYIGAHAVVRGLALLTRDPSLYRSYFPKLEVLAP